MEIDFKKVKAHIKATRLNNRYSQEQIAQQLGITQTAYGRIESGLVDIKLKHIEKLSEIFGCTSAQLLDPNVDDTHGPYAETELKNLYDSMHDMIAILKKQLKDKDQIIELLTERENFNRKKKNK
jgi:transcriptional regulator with XRE-family HTH domain